MLKKEVKLGRQYVARLHGTFTTVRIDEECSFGGWYATNMKTMRRVRIKSAAKLRSEVDA